MVPAGTRRGDTIANQLRVDEGSARTRMNTDCCMIRTTRTIHHIVDTTNYSSSSSVELSTLTWRHDRAGTQQIQYVLLVCVVFSGRDRSAKKMRSNIRTSEKKLLVSSSARDWHYYLLFTQRPMIVRVPVSSITVVRAHTKGMGVKHERGPTYSC